MTKSKQSSGILGVDFDGTLAQEVKPYDPKKAGPPVKDVLKRVKAQLKSGRKVVIFTARLNSQAHTPSQIRYTRRLINAWCKHYLGKALPITSEKHPNITEYWDNRAVHIETNTGKILGAGE